MHAPPAPRRPRRSRLMPNAGRSRNSTRTRPTDSSRHCRDAAHPHSRLAPDDRGPTRAHHRGSFAALPERRTPSLAPRAPPGRRKRPPLTPPLRTVASQPPFHTSPRTRTGRSRHTSHNSPAPGWDGIIRRTAVAPHTPTHASHLAPRVDGQGEPPVPTAAVRSRPCHHPARTLARASRPAPDDRGTHPRPPAPPPLRAVAAPPPFRTLPLAPDGSRHTGHTSPMPS